MTADKQDDFIEKLTDSVTQAQTFSSTAKIIIGDFNAGNIFLDMQTHGRRTVTVFDTKLKDTLDGLNLTQIINPRPAGGAQRAPPCGFSQIAPEVLGISL